MNTIERKKVIGIIRVSTDQQADDDRGGMPRQRAVIEKTVQLQDLDCIETIELAGVSGTEVRDDPRMKRILSLIQSRQIQGVVVADLDRLFRPAGFDDFALLEVFRLANAKVFSGGQNYDFGSPEGKLMVLISSAVAGFERQMILKRSGDAVREMCKAGRHPFGMRQLPRGVTYDRKSGIWGINEDIAPVLEAFRLIDEDDVQNIAEVARLTGIAERALHNLIRNRLYMGERWYETGRSEQKILSKRGKMYKPKVPLPPEKVIVVTVFKTPPVSRERFARVQAKLKASYKAWKAERQDEDPINIVRSIARCASCTSRLYFSQDRRRPRAFSS